MTYTVLIENSVTGSGRYCGTFDTLEQASSYAETKAALNRDFVTYTVWGGTPGGAWSIDNAPTFKGLK